MKKIIVSILTLLYFTTSTGATVYTHYCMGRLAEWGFGQNKSETCGKCGMDKNAADTKNCCKDEHQFLKNSADQKVVESSFLLIGVVGSALLPCPDELLSTKIASVTEENPVSNAPPRSSSIALFILTRTFLI